MTNKEIARLLKNMAAAYTILGENRFKIIAYENAASSISSSVQEVQQLAREGKLSQIGGVGPSISAHLDELFKKGKSIHFDTVLAKIPPAVFPLLEIPGFGPKKAIKLVSKLGLKNKNTAIADLQKAAREGKIAPLEGFGEKSQQDILKSIDLYRNLGGKEQRMPLPFASNIASDYVSYLEKLKSTQNIATLGSLRRSLPTIGDVDLAVATDNPPETIHSFIAYPSVSRVVEEGSEGATVLLQNSEHVDLRIIDKKRWGSMLQYFTGSKKHNIRLREYALKKGYSLNEYGIKEVKTGKMHLFETEESLYKFLGLLYIPPEIREDRGEIEAAEKNQLPDLIQLSQVKGDLQVHSSYPIEPSHDLGADTMKDMINKAKKLGYKFVAFTEHNPSISKHTTAQIIEIMKKRKAKIEQLKDSTKSVRILNLLEIDIMTDGVLALPDKALDYIDAGLASIHSSFNQPPEQMTRRVLKGLSHPKIKIYAHPTGRLINQREGIKAQYSEIFTYCAQNHKAIEINAYPLRLDLPDDLIIEARKKGCKFTLGTDAHDISGMDLMTYGVSLARRGWLTRHDILNALEYNELYQWLTN